jgi:uncharacterized protein (UPF0333 family)
MKTKLQYGFAHLGLLLLVVVAAVIAVAGYKVANSNKTADTPSTATTAGQEVIEVKTASDLDKVKASLQNANLDSDLNPDSLNQDVNSLL